jgi:hypothetical protein
MALCWQQLSTAFRASCAFFRAERVDDLVVVDSCWSGVVVMEMMGMLTGELSDALIHARSAELRLDVRTGCWRNDWSHVKSRFMSGV